MLHVSGFSSLPPGKLSFGVERGQECKNSNNWRRVKLTGDSGSAISLRTWLWNSDRSPSPEDGELDDESVSSSD